MQNMSKNQNIDTRQKPIYFLDLTIANIRCFKGKHDLNLSDSSGKPAQWTIILGDNGTGKTTLLKCLASFHVTSFNETFTIEHVEFLKNDSNDMKKMIRANNLYHGFLSPIEKGKFLSACSLNTSPNGGIVFTEKEIRKMERLNLFAYGASRRMGSGELSANKKSDAVYSLFNENMTALINAEAWLLETDFAVKNATGETKVYLKKRYELIKNTLKQLLPDVQDFRIKAITKSQTQARMEVQTPYGWVEMQHLSHGYLTFIAWIVDLAARLVEQYRDSDNPLQEPAIVLIDEIDLHLHPKWQRQIIQFLTKIFSNTQFIVTAHSPLIVQAVDEANLVLLKREGDSIKIYNDIEHQMIKNWRIGQILTSDLFDIPSSRSPKYDTLLEKQKELLHKPDLTVQDEEELKAINKELEKMPLANEENEAALNALEQAIKILQTND